MSKPIEQADAAAFVRDHYGARATPPALLGAGEWSRAYAFRLDGSEAVIRFGAHGEDFAKDRVMGERADPRLPIPRVLELGQTPWGYFAVAERAYGQPLDGLDGGGMRRTCPDVLRLLDCLRDADVSAGSGYGGWDAEQRAPLPTWRDVLIQVAAPRDRLAGWQEVLAASPGDRRTFDDGLKALEALARRVPDVGRHLIHNDLLHYNVLVRDGRVAAVLDWGNSLYGDHVYDAAWLIYWWPWYPEWSAIDIRREVEAHWDAGGRRPADLELRLHCCLLHIGLDSVMYNAFTRRWDDLRRNIAQLRSYL